MERTTHGADGNFPGLLRLIRSIQRIEGNPDCFGAAGEYCDRLDCKWRCYCLESPENRSVCFEQTSSQDTGRVKNDCFQR